MARVLGESGRGSPDIGRTGLGLAERAILGAPWVLPVGPVAPELAIREAHSVQARRQGLDRLQQSVYPLVGRRVPEAP